jgi:hypothetical protein
MAESNPNGANQYQLDPRQKKCWELYISPTSKTFGNATQSAISAGYEPDYADQITTVEWFKGKVRRLNMLSKGEKVLDETLSYDAIDEKGKIDVGIAKIKLDAAKFVNSTLGKDEGYSTRQEFTGKDGERLIASKEEKDLIDKVFNQM